MTRTIRFVLILILLGAPTMIAQQVPKMPAGGAAALAGSAGSMSGMLSKQLGVTEKQAQGGLGSMLTLAKEKLPAADFTKVAGAVPGASNLMGIAKSSGAVTGALGGMAGLTGALGKLGISPAIAAKFVPQAAQLIGTAGGPQVASLLSGVFK